MGSGYANVGVELVGVLKAGLPPSAQTLTLALLTYFLL